MEGSLSKAIAFLCNKFNPSTKAIEVVVFPSPALVGVIALTKTNEASFFVLNLVSTSSLIFALSFILTLKDNLSDFGGRYTKNSIIRSIVGGVSLTLVGVILLVHDLVCVSHYYNEDNGFTISLVLPIVIMVFGILFLAIAIANKVLDKTFFGEEIEETEVTVNKVSPDLE